MAPVNELADSLGVTLRKTSTSAQSLLWLGDSTERVGRVGVRRNEKDGSATVQDRPVCVVARQGNIARASTASVGTFPHRRLHVCWTQR